MHSHPVPSLSRPELSSLPLRILALEDNEEDYQALRRFLSPLGPDCGFTWATSVAEAMHALASEAFDLCFLDLHLPDGHGLQVLEWVTDHLPEVATVVMTGDEHPENDQLALVAGADYFLCKSEGCTAAVTRAVRYALAHRHRLRELRVKSAGTAKVDEPLPICMDCKKIRDEHDYWHALEAFLQQHAALEFTHGFCPACYQRRLVELQQFTETPEDRPLRPEA